MTHDPNQPHDPDDHEIPELFDRLEARVASPDPDAIRAEAGRRGAARRRTLSMAGAFALIAVIAGTALWMTREGPSETATAAENKAANGNSLEDATVVTPVASDSAPLEFTPGSIAAQGLIVPMEWLQITSTSGASPLQTGGGVITSLLLFTTPIQDLGKLTFTSACSTTTYTVRWHMNGGFTVIAVDVPPGELPPNFLDPLADSCLENATTINFLARGDSVSFDSDANAFVVRGQLDRTYAFTLGNTEAANLVVVPELTALRVDESITILENVGLQADEAAQSRRSLVVLSTDPPAGTRVEPGSTVTLLTDDDLYLVGETIIVPNLSGLSYYEAVESLEAAGLQASPSSTPIVHTREYVVISTDPRPGIEVPAGSDVSILAAAITTPTDEASEDATATLREFGRQVNVIPGDEEALAPFPATASSGNTAFARFDRAVDDSTGDASDAVFVLSNGCEAVAHRIEWNTDGFVLGEKLILPPNAGRAEWARCRSIGAQAELVSSLTSGQTIVVSSGEQPAVFTLETTDEPTWSLTVFSGIRTAPPSVDFSQ